MGDYFDVYSDEDIDKEDDAIVDNIGKPIDKRSEPFFDFATYIMQLPNRFHGLWVLRPPKEFNYVEGFYKRIGPVRYKDDIIISSLLETNIEHRIPVRDKNNWLLTVFSGTEEKESLFGSLKIEIEHDELKNSCALLDSIMTAGDIRFNEFWLVGIYEKPYVLSRNDMTVWFSFLKTQIPVRLVDEDKMPLVNPPKRVGRSDDDYKRTMEVLGVYQDDVNSQKEILLCPKRIKECADYLNKDNKDKNIDWGDLLIIVYLHELAHAALDSSIGVDEIENSQDTKNYSINFDGKKLNSSNDAPAFAMEESLANMIMLKYLDWFAELEPDFYKLFEIAMSFVEDQIDEYKWGVNQFEADVDWTKWRDYKSKNEKSDMQLVEWFNNSFGREDYTKEMFDKVFE